MLRHTCATRSKSHPRVGRPEPGSAISTVAWYKLGYPLYLTTILGTRKVLSIIGLAVPIPQAQRVWLMQEPFSTISGEVFPHLRWQMDSTMVAASGRCIAVILLWCRWGASRTITEKLLYAKPGAPCSARGSQRSACLTDQSVFALRPANYGEQSELGLKTSHY